MWVRKMEQMYLYLTIKGNTDSHVYIIWKELGPTTAWSYTFIMKIPLIILVGESAAFLVMVQLGYMTGMA
jgi:hypothetical protein